MRVVVVGGCPSSRFRAFLLTGPDPSHEQTRAGFDGLLLGVAALAVLIGRDAPTVGNTSLSWLLVLTAAVGNAVLLLVSCVAFIGASFKP